MKKIIFVLISVSILAGLRCSLDLPDDPRPPKWVMRFEDIPLFKADTLIIGENLKRDKFNRLGPDSILSINRNGEKTINLADKLKIGSRTLDVSTELGTFKVNAEQRGSSVIDFTEIYPELADFKGGTGVVPSKDIGPVEKYVTLTDFDSVNVVNGRVLFDITNYLGFDLVGDVRMAMIDAGRGMAPIDTFKINQLRNGETRIFYVDLQNQMISSNILTVLFGHSNGSEGQTVTIPADARIESSVTPENVTANEAYGARLKEQVLNLSQSVDLSTDSLTVRKGEIEYGSILLEIDNDFGFGIGLEIEVLNIYDVNGDPFKLSLDLSPGDRGSSVVYLDNGSIDLDGTNLNFRIKMRIFPDVNGKYDLKSADKLAVLATINEIQLSSVTADFSLGTGFPEIGEEVFKDSDKKFVNFDFHDVWLRFRFLDTPFNLGLNLKFRSERPDTSYAIRVQANVPANGELLMNRHGVNNNGESPTIVDLFNMVPESLFVSGNVRVMGQNVTFSKDDNIGVHYELDFPLSFETKNAHYSLQDSLKIGEKTRQNIRDFARGASVSLSVINALPLSGFMSCYIGADSANVDEELFTIVLPRAQLNADGIVVTPASGNFSVEIDQQKFIDLANSNFYKLELRADDLPEVTLTAKDYLILQNVIVSGRFLMDPDNL